MKKKKKKRSVIRLMTDIDAREPNAVREFTRLCNEDRETALYLMIDGEIITKTNLPDGSASLDYIMPDHRALAIFGATNSNRTAPREAGAVAGGLSRRALPWLRADVISRFYRRR